MPAAPDAHATRLPEKKKGNATKAGVSKSAAARGSAVCGGSCEHADALSTLQARLNRTVLAPQTSLNRALIETCDGSCEDADRRRAGGGAGGARCLLFTYAQVCSRMLTYAHTCRRRSMHCSARWRIALLATPAAMRARRASAVRSRSSAQWPPSLQAWHEKPL